jgi:hypothetical protein
MSRIGSSIESPSAHGVKRKLPTIIFLIKCFVKVFNEKLYIMKSNKKYALMNYERVNDRLCGQVVSVLGYRSGGPGSIPGTTRKKSSGSGTGSTQPREYN